MSVKQFLFKIKFVLDKITSNNWVSNFYYSLSWRSWPTKFDWLDSRRLGKMVIIFYLEKFLNNYLQLQCCGIEGPKDWDRNNYFNCSSKDVGSREACGVPFSCCKRKPNVCFHFMPFYNFNWISFFRKLLKISSVDMMLENLVL